MAGIKIISDNRKARFNYTLEDTLEVGMVLTGSEVKSLRDGACQLKDSYIVIQNQELYLVNAHISTYQASSYNNHEPERKRKLLAHKDEIEKLEHKTVASAYTIVPTKIYFKRGRVKLEIALAKGKKLHDKRQSIKKSDAKRDIDRALKKSRN
ncbi:MAG: SsrA-binding protein SmpB [Bdellovibrionota bacterium]|nr:SsrA-binding protein SmpB [Bdellovibrionota bacterium]